MQIVGSTQNRPWVYAAPESRIISTLWFNESKPFHPSTIHLKGGRGGGTGIYQKFPHTNTIVCERTNCTFSSIWTNVAYAREVACMLYGMCLCLACNRLTWIVARGVLTPSDGGLCAVVRYTTVIYRSTSSAHHGHANCEEKCFYPRKCDDGVGRKTLAHDAFIGMIVTTVAHGERRPL